MSVPAIQLSVGLPSFSADNPGGWDPLFARVRLLDGAGIDRLVVSDHVVFGEHLEDYGRPENGGQAGGRQPTGPDGHWLEPLTTLSAIAAMTTRIRLGTGVLLAALRRPVVLAKTAATLDVISGGRLDLGVGVGWQREEYEAAGLNFAARGELLNASLEICQLLWREQRASYKSTDLTFEGIHTMPKPLQPGGVPIWVSGTVNSRVVARVARFGAGWIPWGSDAADVVTGIRRMRHALEALHYDPSGLQVVGHLPIVRNSDRTVNIERSVEVVPALVSAGVTDFRASLPVDSDHGAASTFLQQFVAAFRTQSA